MPQRNLMNGWKTRLSQSEVLFHCYVEKFSLLERVKPFKPEPLCPHFLFLYPDHSYLIKMCDFWYEHTLIWYLMTQTYLFLCSTLILLFFYLFFLFCIKNMYCLSPSKKFRKLIFPCQPKTPVSNLSIDSTS